MTFRSTHKSDGGALVLAGTSAPPSAALLGDWQSLGEAAQAVVVGAAISRLTKMASEMARADHHG
jgi:putative N-acetylmannosamine-6-phosphate epimerase